MPCLKNQSPHSAIALARKQALDVAAAEKATREQAEKQAKAKAEERDRALQSLAKEIKARESVEAQIGVEKGLRNRAEARAREEEEARKQALDVAAAEKAAREHLENQVKANAEQQDKVWQSLAEDIKTGEQVETQNTIEMKLKDEYEVNKTAKRNLAWMRWFFVFFISGWILINLKDVRNIAFKNIDQAIKLFGGETLPTKPVPNAGKIQKIQPMKKTISGQEFVFHWIPPGEFLMGSPATEAEREDNEIQHRVVLSQGFWLLETEVTQAMWQAVMGNNPSNFKGPNRPVENVSHDDVQGFLQKLKTITGEDYRLPSEAEWEYACRAGTTTPFHYGERLDASKANFDGNYPYGGAAKGSYRQATTDVKSFQPNAWGLYDMHGNVWEWCADWYGAYPEKTIENPIGPSQGTVRVLHGGSWRYDGGSCRSAVRRGNAPGDRDWIIGFRLATSSSGK